MVLPGGERSSPFQGNEVLENFNFLIPNDAERYVFCVAKYILPQESETTPGRFSPAER